MDRREFMVACGLVPVRVGHEQHIMECRATNVAFWSKALVGSDNEIKGEGTWWLKKAGDVITVKLLGKDFFCQIAVLNFAENVDYVDAMTTRKEPSPLYAEFEKMFGFRG